MVEMIVDRVLNDDEDRDTVDQLIDDIAHHCRCVTDAIIDVTTQT